MTRKQLAWVITGLFGFGLAAAAIPFLKSLAPTDRAEAARAAWSMPDPPPLEPGQVLIRDVQPGRRSDDADGTTLRWGSRDMIIRDLAGRYHWFRLPTWEGKFLMPNFVWGQWEGLCEDFGPTMDDGRLARDATIQCNDPDFGNWPARDATWHINGKALDDRFPDLPRWVCLVDSDREEMCREHHERMLVR